MAYIFQGSDAAPDLYDQSLALRHEVFDRQLQWDVTSQDGREYDDFDTDDTFYTALTVSSAAANTPAFFNRERVIGTWRMLPTTGPYMLSEIFADPLGCAVPRQSDVWEMSRLAADPSVPRGAAYSTAIPAALFHAALIFAADFGLTGILVVHDRPMARLTRLLLGYGASWQSDTVMVGRCRTSAAIYRTCDPTAFARRHGLEDRVRYLERVRRAA
ncbi:MAG: acyl-homoserine-lactone synthase [Rhodothalassiaceae bacterium]